MTTLSPLTILPLSVTIIGAAFAIVILNHYFDTRRRPHELVWGIAFVLFSVAAATQVIADLNNGWSPFLARTYYLTGAILNVLFLGLGTIYLLFPRRVSTAALLVTLVITAFSTLILYTVPLNTEVLAHSQRTEWKEVFNSNSAPALLAAFGSGLGSIVVIVGALWSGVTFWRKRIMKGRMVGVFLLAAGTFIVALGGTLKGLFNNDHFLYPTMAVGVIAMFVGYLQTIRPAPAQMVSQVSSLKSQVAPENTTTRNLS
jgi:hypothetical protein